MIEVVALHFSIVITYQFSHKGHALSCRVMFGLQTDWHKIHNIATNCFVIFFCLINRRWKGNQLRRSVRLHKGGPGYDWFQTCQCAFTYWSSLWKKGSATCRLTIYGKWRLMFIYSTNWCGRKTVILASFKIYVHQALADV